MSGPTPGTRVGRWRALFGPLLLAHFVAYPLAFASAVAALPLAMLFRKAALLAAGNEGASNSLLKGVARDLSLTPIEAAQVQIVMEFVLWVSAVVALAVHLSALPWALSVYRAAARSEPRKVHGHAARRTFGWLVAALFAVVFVVGGAGWIWVVTL